jgi:hypothetical protein
VNFWSLLIARVISGVMSILDASNLRNRVYDLQDEHEIMWTALDDIKRMYPDHASAEFARRTLKQIKRTYGRD